MTRDNEDTCNPMICRSRLLMGTYIRLSLSWTQLGWYFLLLWSFISPFASLFTPSPSISLPITHIFICVICSVPLIWLNSYSSLSYRFHCSFVPPICNLISWAPLLSLPCFRCGLSSRLPPLTFLSERIFSIAALQRQLPLTAEWKVWLLQLLNNEAFVLSLNRHKIRVLIFHLCLDGRVISAVVVQTHLYSHLSQ